MTGAVFWFERLLQWHVTILHWKAGKQHCRLKDQNTQQRVKNERFLMGKGRWGLVGGGGDDEVGMREDGVCVWGGGMGGGAWKPHREQKPAESDSAWLAEGKALYSTTLVELVIDSQPHYLNELLSDDVVCTFSIRHFKDAQMAYCRLQTLSSNCALLCSPKRPECQWASAFELQISALFFLLLPIRWFWRSKRLKRLSDEI